MEELNEETTTQDLVDNFDHYLNKRMYTKCREIATTVINSERYDLGRMMAKQLDAAEGGVMTS